MTPYEAPLIAILLRKMPPDRLGAIQPADFYRWPTKKITPLKIVKELIANERASRGRVA